MNYKIVDTHCHFDFPPFSHHERESIRLAKQSGVNKLIAPAVCAERFIPIINLSEAYSNVYAALGLHPLYIEHHNDGSLEQLADCLKKRPNKLVALGEIGLDSYIDNPQMPRQLTLLQQQLTLAKEHNLPVILHSRRTHDLLAQQLRKARLAKTGVVHGFSGSLEQAQAFIKLGFYIGVGGVITYPRAQKTRRAIAALPLDRLVLETDSPDMPLFGHQGKPNRPELIVEIMKVLGELRNEPIQHIAEQIYLNTHRLFALC